MRVCVDVQGYVHVAMMYQEDVFIREDLYEGEYKPNQVSDRYLPTK
jgi:hypothetical protein